MTNIRDLLERGAGADEVGFTATDVAARVRRRRFRRQAAGAVLGTLVLVAGTVGAWTLFDRPDEVQVATHPNPADLEAILVGEWGLTDLGIVAGPVDPIWLPTLTFEADGSVHGSMGCNQFSGEWELDGDDLALSYRVPNAACLEAPRMNIEEHLRQLLASPMEVELLGDDGRTIELRSDDRHATYRKIVVTRSDLTDGEWTATRSSELGWAQDVAGAPLPSLTIKADGTISGHLVCNSFGSHWSLADNHLILDALVQSLRGCGPEEADLVTFLTEEPHIRWLDSDPDRLVLRDGERWLEMERSERSTTEPGEVDITVGFEVLFTDRSRTGHIGMLGSATDAQDLVELWDAFGLAGMAGAAPIPIPEVDFDRQVVVALVIPDDECPPELVNIAVDGAVRMPVFEQPDGFCHEPLIPKVYVVALSHELAPPGSVLRYPDDPELQTLREGPFEISIWPAAGVPPSPTNLATVAVFFNTEGAECDATSRVLRQVLRGAATTEALTSVLDQLLAGPTTAEARLGLWSFFGPGTRGALLRVEVESGVAHVDLRNVAGAMNNASTSCGSAALMASLTRTVTQFDGVESAVFYFDGDAEAFYGWLQGDPPPEARPSGW